jgi:hypothetical protein
MPVIQVIAALWLNRYHKPQSLLSGSGVMVASGDEGAHQGPEQSFSMRDRRKFGGQAATAACGYVSLAGWNLCPKPEPSVPL